MAYAVIDHSIMTITPAKEEVPGYFHFSDIEILKTQEGAKGILAVNVTFNTNRGALEGMGLVAVTELTASGPAGILDQHGDLIAILCPPWTDTQGGLKVLTPDIHPDDPAFKLGKG